MGANQSQLNTQSQSCLNGNLKNTPVFVTETTNGDGSESTTISLSNFDGCSYNRTIKIDKSKDLKNLEYSVFYSTANGSNSKRKVYDLEEGFTNNSTRTISTRSTTTTIAEFNKSTSNGSNSKIKVYDLEGFTNDSTISTTATIPANEIPPVSAINNDLPFSKTYLLEYNDSSIYALGTVVKFDSGIYRLTTFIGINGYNPEKFPNYWTQVTSVTDSTPPPKPPTIPLDPLPVVEGPTKPANNDIILNEEGPSWGQYVIRPSLIPNSVILGDSFMAGFTRIVIPDQTVNYSDSNTYYLGDVVNYNGKTYLNLSFKDPRGGSYTGSYQVSPDKDKNVWKEVSVVLSPPIPGKINVTSATYGLNCNASLKDNRTTLFRKLTANELKLGYTYDPAKTGGDPAKGCNKELNITYNCGDTRKDKNIHLKGEAANRVVLFDCTPPPPITTKNFTFSSLKSGSLIAWFDGNDVNADGRSVADATGINIWKDKSNYNNDASRGTWGSPPVILSNNLNKLSVVNFQGSSELSFIIGIKLKAYTIVSLQFSKGPYDNYQRLLHGQSGGDGRLFYGLGGSDEWVAGFGNGGWTNLDPNTPKEKTDGKWVFTDVVVNVPEKTAQPSFNGTLQDKKSMPIDGFDSMTIGCQNGGIQPWKGLVGEILVFNGAMNNSDLQIVQGYLAWKWGLQDELPDDHSYKYINMKVLPDPIPEITSNTFSFSTFKSANLIGWYDANDINGDKTNIPDGTQIKVWVDKSKEGNDALIGNTNGPTVLANKLNNLSVLDLKGTTTINASFDIKLKKYSIFSVQFSKGEYNDWQRLISGQSNGDGRILYGLYSGTDVWATALGNGGWTNLEKNTPEKKTNDKWYFTDITVDTTANTALSSFNGNAQDIKSVPLDGFDSITIGSINGSQAWKGLVGEILIFDGIISDNERQIVQGYLAWKWNLQKNLFFSHPYKHVNMKVIPFPAQGLSDKKFKFDEIKSAKLFAWFDANDSNGDGTIILNGTEVPIWSDKTVNGNDAIEIGSNSPIIVSNSINKLSALDLQGKSQLTVSFGTTLTSYSIFTVQFAKRLNNGQEDYQRLLSGQPIDNLFYGIGNQDYNWHLGFAIKQRWSYLGTPTPVGLTGAVSSGGLWTFTDLVVDVNQSTASSSFNGILQNKINVQMNGLDKITIGSGDGFGQFWKGLVGEILIFNGVIDESDRRIIQAYLATKWGLQQNLPRKHLYKFTNMILIPDPVTVSPIADTIPGSVGGKTLRFWGDATDPNADGSTLNNGPVKNWNDKSNKKNNLIPIPGQPTPLYRKNRINSLPTFDFRNASGLYSNPFMLSANVTLFWVGTIRKTDRQSGTLWGHFNNRNNDIQLRKNNTQDNISWHTNNDNDSSLLPITYDVPTMYSCTMTNGAAMFMQQTTLAGTTVKNVNRNRTIKLSLARMWLGLSDSNEASICTIGEIIYYQSVLTSDERQKVEGYLGKKWGLDYYLPTNHPFKNNATPPPIPEPGIELKFVQGNDRKTNNNNQQIVVLYDNKFPISPKANGLPITGDNVPPGTIIKSYRFGKSEPSSQFNVIFIDLNNPISETDEPVFYIPKLNGPVSIKSGIVFWGDATDPNADGTLSLTSGQDSNKWADKSGYSNDLGPITGQPIPKWRKSGINKLPTYDFTNASGLYTAPFMLSQDITLFWVGIIREVPNPWGTLWGHFNNHDFDIQLRRTSNSNMINWYSNYNNSSTQIPVNYDIPVMFTCTMKEGTDMFMQYIDSIGTSVINVKQKKSMQIVPARMHVGLSSTNEAINSNIGEIIYYQRVLSTDEIQKIEGYLGKKWGLDYYFPDNHPFKNKNPPPKIPEFIETNLIIRKFPYISMANNGKFIAIAISTVNVYLSSDFGSTWKSLRDGKEHPVNHYTSVFISTDAKIMVINGWQTLFYSTDQGATWNESVRNDAYGNLTVSYPSNIVGSDDGSVLYGGSYKICKSVDGGKTWNIISEVGLNEGDLVMNFACSSNGSVIIFARRAGDGGGRIFISRDSGNSWAATSLPRMYAQKIFCSSDGKIISVSTYDMGANPTIYVSTDTGNTWTAKNTLPRKLKSASGFGMSGDGSLMVFGGQDWWGGPKDVLFSYDLGDSWTKTKAPQYNFEYFGCSRDGKMVVAAPHDRDRTSNNVCICKDTVESFTDITLSEKKYCNLPNKKYIDGVLNEKINSDGSVVTTITIAPFVGCDSGKIITIKVSNDMKKLILENNFKGLDGSNIIETYNYKIYENNSQSYNTYITIIGIFIILCLLTFYLYKRRTNLLTNQ